MYSNKNERANNKSRKKIAIQVKKDAPEKKEQQYEPEKYAPQDPDEFLNIACI